MCHWYTVLESYRVLSVLSCQARHLLVWHDALMIWKLWKERTVQCCASLQVNTHRTCMSCHMPNGWYHHVKTWSTTLHHAEKWSSQLNEIKLNDSLMILNDIISMILTMIPHGFCESFLLTDYPTPDEYPTRRIVTWAEAGWPPVALGRPWWEAEVPTGGPTTHEGPGSLGGQSIQ